MMRLALYAPLKPAGHPVPSGDREMARNLLAALAFIGAQVDQPATLRSRDGSGDKALQDRLFADAEAQIAETLSHPAARKWQAWVTYHSYYKAPDLIGPAVSRALGIPYLIIEPTRAGKRLTGPWSRFAQAADAACDHADVLFYVTQQDAEMLLKHARKGQHVIHLHPFLPLDSLPPPTTASASMLAVGMMRAAAKLPSYRIIAKTLPLLRTEWQLKIAGNGPARGEVEALMRPFGSRVTFLGQLDDGSMADAYARASLLFWPGVDEAFGLSYLEAQARGVPVIAQDRPGVRDVLAPGDRPDPQAGPKALARQIDAYQSERDRLVAAGKAARAFIAERHLLPVAARTLRDGLAKVGVQ